MREFPGGLVIKEPACCGYSQKEKKKKKLNKRNKKKKVS